MKILNPKSIGIAVGILAGGVVAWLMIRGKKKAIGEGVIPSKESYTAIEYKAPTGVVWPLKFGSGSNAAEKEVVRRLQTWLNTKIRIPIRTLAIDGIFGVLTRAALVEVTGKDTISKAEFDKISTSGLISTKYPRFY